MRRFILVLASLSLILAACAPAATPAPTSAPITQVVAATVAPDLTATAAYEATQLHLCCTATPAFTPIPKEPAFFEPRKDLTGLKGVADWDSTFRDPGAVIYHAGQFHMFYNGINGWPRPVGIGYATSADGVQWKIQAKEPVFSVANFEAFGLYNGPNQFATSVLVEDDGTWVLYYYTLSGRSFSGRQSIGRATAPAPTGPWVADPEPVLTNGPEGAWDAMQVGSANVIKTDAGYVMYYDGMGAGNKSMIGLATSPDGKKWTKYDDPATTEALFAESDPVLQPTAEAWDATRVLEPNVVKTENGWAMVYIATTGKQKFSTPLTEFGYALSPNGITWTKAENNPVLSSKDFPAWAGVYLVSMVARQDQWFLYFDVGLGNSTNINLFTHTGTLE